VARHAKSAPGMVAYRPECAGGGSAIPGTLPDPHAVFRCEPQAVQFDFVAADGAVLASFEAAFPNRLAPAVEEDDTEPVVAAEPVRPSAPVIDPMPDPTLERPTIEPAPEPASPRTTVRLAGRFEQDNELTVILEVQETDSASSRRVSVRRGDTVYESWFLVDVNEGPFRVTLQNRRTGKSLEVESRQVTALPDQ